MNHNDVQLVGVFDPNGGDEAFIYSINAPVNLWVGALCEDGSRMSMNFMGHIMNGLIDGDLFNFDDTYRVENQVGIGLVATVGEFVAKSDLQAFMAESDVVRRVSVTPTGVTS